MAIPDPVWAESREALVDSTQFITTSAGTASTAYGDETLRVGPNDLLEVTVFEAPELDRSVRVDNTGRISLPLLGDVIAGGLTPRELEGRLETILRERFIRDPHVSVQVSEMQSHAVSVVGAVARPGVFQIREARPLLELIALAGGLAPNAGESVIIVRGRPSAPNGATAVVGVQADASEAAPMTLTVDLQALLESGGAHDQVTVHPGDQVKVIPAGLIYVVGEVRKPGAFPLARGPDLTVLRAIAVAEGFGPNAAKGRAMIIRTSASGERIEVPVDLGDVLAGRAADVELQPQDVVFVPSSRTRAVTLGAVDALVRMVTLRGVF